MARKWKQANFSSAVSFKFEHVGDAIEGKLISIRSIVSTYGPCQIANLTDDEGGDWCFVVTSGMNNLPDLVGYYIRVEYEGDKVNEKTKRTFKSFKIMYDEESSSEELPF